MKISLIFAFLILFLITASADRGEPRLIAKGTEYNIAIYKDLAVIERKSDGEKKEVKDLLWGESDLEQKQPTTFFDDESKMALFLMKSYYYAIVNVEELFKEDGEVLYASIEGGIFKTPYVVDRTNTSWSLDGIYPKFIIRGKASNSVGKLEFKLDCAGLNSKLITSNKNAPEIITLRGGSRSFRYEYK